MISASRIDLAVPYARKEEAKALGARWDGGLRTWYAPPGTDLRHFDRRWLPGDLSPEGPGEEPDAPDPENNEGAERGVSLAELLTRVKGILHRGLPEAVWVRAEISELRVKNGHHYLTLAERDGRGDLLANAKGILWKGQAAGVVAKFEEATGEGLRPDIKVLCLVRVRFDPLFGLDLIVEDIDPSYTLGDLAAKLARIREVLVDEAIYGRNRLYPPPAEFVRVAVISPETSAGLGDFRREADRLHDAGLCELVYFGATFQGPDAPGSIRAALDAAYLEHEARPFDALVVIRGGGSVTDLAWLNDLDLARHLCLAPAPVFTGIGHERDSTILDEVAGTRFDTPSKVALLIAATIRNNAVGALADLDRIRAQVGRILTRERAGLGTQAGRIEEGARSVLDRAARGREGHLAVIRTAATYGLRESRRAVEAASERLADEAENAACRAGLALARLSESIARRAQLHAGRREAEAARLAQAVALEARAALDAKDRELD